MPPDPERSAASCCSKSLTRLLRDLFCLRAASSSSANRDRSLSRAARRVPDKRCAFIRADCIVDRQFERSFLSAFPVKIESCDGAGHDMVARLRCPVPRPVQFFAEGICEEGADFLREVQLVLRCRIGFDLTRTYTMLIRRSIAKGRRADSSLSFQRIGRLVLHGDDAGTGMSS